MPGGNAAPSAAGSGRLLILLVFLTGINHCCYAASNFALVLYAIKLGASPATVGVLIALFSIFGALTAVAAGRWVDRIGARLPMLAGSAAMAAGAALAFFWRELGALFVVSTVVGTAYNFYFIAQQQLLGRYGGLEDRVKIFGLSGLGISVANFLGPLGAGLALKQLGYSETFLLVALLPAAVFIAVAMEHFPDARPSPTAAPGEAQPKVRHSGGPAARNRRGTLALLNDRELRLIYGVSLLGTVTSQLFNFLMPLYGVQIGLDAFHISWIVGSFALASATSRTVITLLTRRFTPWALLIGSLGAAGLCYCALPFISGLALLLPIGFCMGFAFGTCNPTAQALLYEAAPVERVGEVLGMRVMMAGGVQTVVPLAAGAVSAMLGIGPIFGGFAAALFGCCYRCRDRVRGGVRNAADQGRVERPKPR